MMMKKWVLLSVWIGMVCFLRNGEAAQKKIGFFLDPFLSRGTESLVYPYADYNETLLGNTSFIFFVHLPHPSWERIPARVGEIEEVQKRFEQRFAGRFYVCDTFDEVEEILGREKVDLLYSLTLGEEARPLSKVCKNATHWLTTPTAQAQPGDVSAFISDWVRRQTFSMEIPYLPPIVELENTDASWREELGIPPQAVVFGRYGGFYSFDLYFVMEAICRVAVSNPDWYFVFLNTRKFCDLPNVIFLSDPLNNRTKTKFINTCDAMIHARLEGEILGLPCLEFALKNKPVITLAPGLFSQYATSHVGFLGSKGMYYRNGDDLVKLLCQFGYSRNMMRQGNWSVPAASYTPESVMRRFDALLLRPLFGDN